MGDALDGGIIGDSPGVAVPGFVPDAGFIGGLLGGMNGSCAAAGMSSTAPHLGHFPFFPAFAAPVFIFLPQLVQANSIVDIPNFAQSFRRGVTPTVIRLAFKPQQRTTNSSHNV